jgi:hypothetical protein
MVPGTSLALAWHLPGTSPAPPRHFPGISLALAWHLPGTSPYSRFPRIPWSVHQRAAR